MDVITKEIWGFLKDPSIGFIIFILLVVFVFKLKDIFDVVFLVSERKVRNLKSLRDEVITTKGASSYEAKLLDDIIEMELLNSSLGVLSKDAIPLFSYLSQNLNFEMLYITKKCVKYIDSVTLEINEKSINNRFRVIVAISLFLVIYLAVMITDNFSVITETKWLFMSMTVILIPTIIFFLNKLPSNPEIKKMKEFLDGLDKADYLKFKSNFIAHNNKSVTSPEK